LVLKFLRVFLSFLYGRREIKMSDDVNKELSEKYCPRFGMIAVEEGFVTAEQIKEALSEQLDDNIAKRPHRLLGRILLDRGWVTAQQIETVLDELFRRERVGKETA
jgi:hypothetical protein